MYPNNQGSRVYPDNRDSRVCPNIRGSWVYPNDWGSQVYPNGHGSRVYPNGRGSRVYPNGRVSRARPGWGRRSASALPPRLALRARRSGFALAVRADLDKCHKKNTSCMNSYYTICIIMYEFILHNLYSTKIVV